MKLKYEFLKHTADIKFKAYGKTVNESFENSALAMFHTMYSGKVKAKDKKIIQVQGQDLESLLYNFLEQLIIILDNSNFFVAKCKIKIDNLRFTLKAELHGDDVKNYPANLEVKAVTYNEMFVKKIDKQWVCQVVLDV